MREEKSKGTRTFVQNFRKSGTRIGIIAGRMTLIKDGWIRRQNALILEFLSVQLCLFGHRRSTQGPLLVQGPPPSISVAGEMVKSSLATDN